MSFNLLGLTPLPGISDAPEEDKPAADVPTLTSQKSVTSITSSELSGSDSHCEDTHAH